MSAWHLVFATAVGDETVDRFEAEISDMSRYVGKAGSLDATIHILNADIARRARSVLGGEGKLTVYAYRGETLWWGGFLDSTRLAAGSDGAELVLSGTTFEVYPSRREAWTDGKFKALEQTEIVRRMWNYMQDGPGTALGIETNFPALATRPRDFLWFGSEARTISDIIDEVANNIDGFEWMIDVWDDGGSRRRALRVGFPRIERAGAGIDMTYPGNVATYQVDADATEGATSFRVRGMSERESKDKTSAPEPWGEWAPKVETIPDWIHDKTWQEWADLLDAEDKEADSRPAMSDPHHSRMLAQGYVRVDATVDRTDLWQKDALNAWAKKAVQMRAGVLRIPGALVRLDVGPNVLASSARLRVVDRMFPAGSDGTPSYDVSSRCIGWEMSPDQFNSMDFIKVTFEDPGAWSMSAQARHSSTLSDRITGTEKQVAKQAATTRSAVGAGGIGGGGYPTGGILGTIDTQVFDSSGKVRVRKDGGEIVLAMRSSFYQPAPGDQVAVDSFSGQMVALTRVVQDKVGAGGVVEYAPGDPIPGPDTAIIQPLAGWRNADIEVHGKLHVLRTPSQWVVVSGLLIPPVLTPESDPGYPDRLVFHMFTLPDGYRPLTVINYGQLIIKADGRVFYDAGSLSEIPDGVTVPLGHISFNINTVGFTGGGSSGYSVDAESTVYVAGYQGGSISGEVSPEKFDLTRCTVDQFQSSNYWNSPNSESSVGFELGPAFNGGAYAGLAKFQAAGSRLDWTQPVLHNGHQHNGPESGGPLMASLRKDGLAQVRGGVTGGLAGTRIAQLPQNMWPRYRITFAYTGAYLEPDGWLWRSPQDYYGLNGAVFPNDLWLPELAPGRPAGKVQNLKVHSSGWPHLRPEAEATVTFTTIPGIELYEVEVTFEDEYFGGIHTSRTTTTTGDVFVGIPTDKHTIGAGYYTARVIPVSAGIRGEQAQSARTLTGTEAMSTWMPMERVEEAFGDTGQFLADKRASIGWPAYNYEEFLRYRFKLTDNRATPETIVFEPPGGTASPDEVHRQWGSLGQGFKMPPGTFANAKRLEITPFRQIGNKTVEGPTSRFSVVTHPFAMDASIAFLPGESDPPA